MKNKIKLLTLFAITIFLMACAQKKDLVLEIGEGDSIRLVGGAGLFYCDDPAYANLKMVRTVTMQFANGSARYLCVQEGTKSSRPQEPAGSALTASKPDSGSRSTYESSQRSFFKGAQ